MREIVYFDYLLCKPAAMLGCSNGLSNFDHTRSRIRASIGSRLMKYRMPNRQYVLVVVDRDMSEFTIEGPMIDDWPWNGVVVDAQRVGRNLRCFGMGDVKPGAAAAEWQASHGGIRLAAGSIVWPQTARIPQAS